MHVASVRANSTTAGLSPNNNQRTEVFFAGCRKAAEGYPCPDCFNSVLWSTQGFAEVTPATLFYDIKCEFNKYVTIVGGEPLDQYEDLTEVLKLLNEDKHHVVVVTHYTMAVIEQQYPDILQYANVIIDGEYDKTKRVFDENKKPGIYQVIGSDNQNIWHRVLDKWYLVDKNTADLDKIYYE